MGTTRMLSLLLISIIAMAILATGCSGSSNAAPVTEQTATESQALSSFVQSVGCELDDCNRFMSLDFPSAETAGDLNVVFVGWLDRTRTVTSVTDTPGNAYSLAVADSDTVGNYSQAIYYATNIVASASNTVTVQFKAGAFKALRVLEYSGISTTGPLDIATSGVG